MKKKTDWIRQASLRRRIVIPQAVGMHLVQIVKRLQVCPVATRIREPHTRIVSQIVLVRQVPLLHRGILVVDRESVFEGGRPRRIKVSREGRREGEKFTTAVGRL